MTAVYTHGPLGGMRRGVRRKPAGPRLASLTWDELSARLATAGDGEYEAILAAAASKERSEKARARWQREVDASGWTEASYAQYLEAEAVCAGNLVSSAGTDRIPEGLDAWPFLWTCSTRDADRFASEELREFWLDRPRLTPGAHLRQLRSATRAAEAAALDGCPADDGQDVSEAPRDAQAMPEPEPAAVPEPSEPAAPRLRPWAAAMCQGFRDGTWRTFNLGSFPSRAAAQAACQGIARRMDHQLAWSPAGYQTYAAKVPHAAGAQCAFSFAVSNAQTQED